MPATFDRLVKCFWRGRLLRTIYKKIKIILNSTKYKYFSSSFFVIILGFLIYTYYLKPFNQEIFPTKILLKTFADPIFQKEIIQKIQVKIKDAKEQRKNRSQLLKDIYSCLEEYTEIEAYTVRLGLDKRLQIYIKVQTPVLMLIDKNNYKFIIGSSGYIIAKITNNNHQKTFDKYLKEKN